MLAYDAASSAPGHRDQHRRTKSDTGRIITARPGFMGVGGTQRQFLAPHTGER
jgi:hypothetical protein